MALMPDKSRPQEFSYRGKDIYFSIDTDIGAALRELAKQLKVSLYSILLSAYCLMLRAYTQQDDIIVGSPVANRHYKGTENLLGFFVNTLPNRTIIDSNRLVVDYILNVSQGIIDLQMHQDIPLEKIVAELNLPKDPSQSPLFQVLFGVQSFGKKNFCPWLEEYKPNADSTAAFTTPYAKFNLSTMIDDGGAEIKGVLNYATDFFEESTVRNYLKTYLIILKQFAEITWDYKKRGFFRISEMKFLDPEEYEKIIYQWNETKESTSPQEEGLKNRTVVSLFEERVASSPHLTALVCEEKSWSYQELDKEINCLAHYLKEEEGVGPKGYVLLCMERGAQLIISIFAVLKLGAAYVPVDPECPGQRLIHILEETQASIAIADKGDKIASLLPKQGCRLVDLNTKRKSLFNYLGGATLAFPNVLPSDLAYVIYTSGTTGWPKGVMIEHKSVVNYILNIKSHGLIHLGDSVDFSTNIGFDLSVTTSICSLCIGAQVCIYQGNALDLQSYEEHLKKNKVSFIKHVPSYFDFLLDFLPATVVRHVMLGGEKLKISTIKKMKQCYSQERSEGSVQVPIIYDEYGPTEATVGATLSKINHEEPLTIGVPYDHVQVYVLNDQLSPLSVGAVGELYIGGCGLARGYLKDPILTQEKFLPNPFHLKRPQVTSEKIYKTGDRARWLSNGCLEYLGRLDAQAKIGGFRIELQEIEQILNTYQGISQSVVCLQKMPLPIESTDRTASFEAKAYENGYLTGYYQTKDAKLADEGSMRKHLARVLPDYMIPKFFIHIDRFPLTKNGKIDYQALPKPLLFDADDYQAPTKNLEILIQRIWSDILAIPVHQLSINKNFFDLGGSSLLVLKLKSRIEQALGKKVLKVMDLFKYPTIKSLSDFLTVGFNEEVPKHFPIKTDGKASQHEIAVISMTGAFSGSKDIKHFWSNLLNGKSCVSRLSKKECEAINVSKAKLEHENYLGVGGLVEDADKFDPEFWAISVNDAKLMDPQIRKFLEHSYHALEYGGYINKRNGAKIGVFAGMNQGQYYNLNKDSPTFAKLSEWEKRSLSDPFQLATRVSYLLGLTGVSLTINTACSTSLVTIIEACKNLALGVCDAALAGGVAFTMPEDFGDIAEEGMIFSPDGCCRVFDKQANGTVRGSGVGVVLLKPLQKAREDKDPIFAVIKGYAVNNDGNRKVGYTAPSPLGQVECISQALEQAQISPASIGYFECHGTGTTFGDAIEITALQEVVAKAQNHAGSSCYLGSVKANIGHADTAAGVAGFIKGCKMLDEKMLPPQINYSRPNENLDFKNARLSILTKKQPWDANGLFPRRVGVSSFGIGGTNAHVVLEEYASPEKSAPLTISSERKNQNPICIVPISAKSKEAYREYCLALNHFIGAFPDIALSDIALALQHYREEFSVRNVFICDSKPQLQEYLLSGTPPFEVPPAIQPSILQKELSKEQSGDLFSFYQAIGKLWCSGFSVPWEVVDNIESVKKANSLLPGYSFQKLRCWLETEEGIDPLSCLSLSAKTLLKEVNQADAIEGEIIQAFSEVLGGSSIDKQSNFFDLGGDSLSALRLAKKLSEIFGVKVSAGIVLKHDSIEKLISYWKNTSIKKSFEPSIIGKGEL